MMTDLQRDTINEFWKWVLEHKDSDTTVDHDGEGNLCIWIDFEDLGDFTEQYVSDSENTLQIALYNGYVCVEVSDILGGYGLNMDDVWVHRPESLGE